MGSSTFEEEIQRTGRLVYTNVGCSMMPLIRQHRDLVVIEKPQGRCRKYDVPLYKKMGSISCIGSLRYGKRIM